jgi:phage terminase large subunit
MWQAATSTLKVHSIPVSQRPYTASGAARQMWACKDREVVLEGPAGTGKTRALLEKMHFCALKYPGMRALLVRKTRESLTESALVTLEEKVLPEHSPIAAGAQRRTRKSYDYPNGSSIVVAGLVAAGKDQRAKVMSTEYDLIVIPEATELTEHDYEQLLTRLRNGVMPYQQLLADCNPDAPTHWLHQRCDAGTATVFFSRHQDNPTLYRNGDWTPVGQQYVSEVLGALTGVRRSRLLLGQRAAAEGAVYAFDRARHLIEPFPLPPDWRRIRAIDFGYTNPFVCQWWAIDPDGRMYLYRELYRTQRTVADHAADINRLSKTERIEATVCDHDAEDRATLRTHGIHTIAAYKAVSRGIQAVEQRMSVAGDGKARLMLLSGALTQADPRLVEAKRPTCTEQEFDSYRWAIGSDGRPNKEEPVKADDHGMDALRYAVAYVDLQHIDPRAQRRYTSTGGVTL